MNEIYNRDLVDKDRILNKKKSWRYCLALLFGMFLSVASFGQVSGYTFTQTSGTFTAVSGGTSLIAGGVDSGASPVTDIGFPFTFDGVSYTQFSASSNGWLRLGGTAASAYTSTPLSTSGAGPAIAFMARDGKTNGAVVYTLTGTAPNRVLTVEYPNHYIQYNSLTNTLNAQIKLFEGTNVVQIVYGVSAKATSYTGQVGLVGTANTNFATRTTTTNWSATTAGSANNSTMTWSSTVGPSDGLTLTWAQPTCFIPTLTATTAISETTATINWSAPSTAPSNGYNYEVRTSGAAGSGATGLVSSGAVAAGIVTKDITGLISATSYSVYVQSNCGSGDTSNWTAAGTFATTCTASSIPYTMPIEAVTVPALPLCTSVQNVNADAKTWVSYASITGITGKVMGYSYSGTVAANDWLFTNSLTLNAGTTYQVKFKYKDTGYVEKLKVGIGTSAVNSAMTTTLFDVSTGTSSAVVTQVINFTVPSSGTYTIGFQCYSAANQNVLYLGEISVVLAPSCIEPTALVASAVTANTATLSWTASTSSPSNGYDVYYSTTNTAPLAGTTPTVNNHTASPLNATSLTPASTYYWWVRSDCGGDASTWASGGSFTTTQIAATLPYTQDFSGANNFSFVNGAQINQWVNGSVAGNPGNSIYISNDAGVTNAYTTESTSVTQAYRDIAIPVGATSASFSFDWNANGESTYDYLRVWLVPTSFIPVAGTQITAGTGRIQVGGNFNQQTTWQTYSNATLDLSSFANATMRLVFEWRNDGSGGTQTPAAVDNISLLIPSCVAPTALASSNIATTTATLSWTDSGSNPTNGYDIYYSTTNTAPLVGATPSVDNHAASPLNATDLSPASTYYWWVRSDCDSEKSAWASGGSFTTLCVAFTIPYSENFDTTATGSSAVPSAPTCWSYLETAAGAGSGYTYSFGTPNTTPNHFYLTNSSDNSGSYMLVSPNTTDLSDGSNRVRFYAKAGSAGYVLALGTLSDPLDVNSFTSIQTITLTATYTEYTVNIPAGTDSYLAFKHGLGGTYRSIYIDNVMVENIPSCLAPTALTSSNIATTTATLNWTASSSNPSNGYDVYYSTTNTAPLVGTTPTVNNHTASPLNATGLTASSTYYWWVRSDCGAETSTWTSGGSFVTLCNSVSTFPFVESFEGITSGIPVCWGLAGTTSNGSYNFSSFATGQTGRGVRFNSYINPNGLTGELTTPILDLSSLTAAELKFQFKNPDGGNFQVLISSNGGTTYTSLGTGLTGQTEWLQKTYNITSYISSNVKIKFVGTSNYGDADAYIYLDEIKVQAGCPTGVWVGTTSDWNTASNWADNTVPQACTAVTVNVAAPMTISSDVTVASITLGATAVVTVGSTGVLNVGTISVATGGNLTINSDGVVLQSSTAANTAVATVKRNSSDLFRQDYTLWSSPVAGQNLRAFSTQTLFNRFSSYDNTIGANGDYVQEIITTADVTNKTFTNAKGYLIRMPNNWVEVASSNPAMPYLGSFTGSLNNGAISIALSGVNNKLNLVGNPYASPISIAAFFAANTNLDQTLYFWRKKASATPGNTASGYATYNTMGFVSADTDINGVVPTNIQTGQGFFVVANSATPGNLVFNNSMRNNGAATFYKGATETNELHRLWLNLSSANEVVGQTLIGYKTNATQGVDAGVDALYFNDSATALTSLINNTEYIIQGRSLPFANTDIVPLGFKSNVVGSYTIALANYDGLFSESQDIFLKDNVTGTLNNLKLASYTFTAAEGIFNERFEVHYANTTLGTNNPVGAANTILVGVKDQKITINAGTVTMDKIELIDVAGRVIYMQDGVNATTAILENVVSANQMLVVRISTKENGVVTQKIIF